MSAMHQQLAETKARVVHDMAAFETERQVTILLLLILALYSGTTGSPDWSKESQSHVIFGTKLRVLLAVGFCRTCEKLSKRLLEQSTRRNFNFNLLQRPRWRMPLYKCNRNWKLPENRYSKQ